MLKEWVFLISANKRLDLSSEAYFNIYIKCSWELCMRCKLRKICDVEKIIMYCHQWKTPDHLSLTFGQMSVNEVVLLGEVSRHQWTFAE